MATSENTIEVLNDLIEINNDRVVGYNRAIKESDDNDVDLKAIFHRMADESNQYIAELTREVVKLGGEPESGTTVRGKVYRAWMDVKAAFTASDRYAILQSCEFGEDAAQRAYKDALDADDPLTPEVRQLIANQKASLKISHDTIKKYRNLQGNASSDLTKDNDSLTSSGTGFTNSTGSASTDASSDLNDVTTTGNRGTIL